MSVVKLRYFNGSTKVLTLLESPGTSIEYEGHHFGLMLLFESGYDGVYHEFVKSATTEVEEL